MKRVIDVLTQMDIRVIDVLTILGYRCHESYQLFDSTLISAEDFWKRKNTIIVFFLMRPERRVDGWRGKNPLLPDCVSIQNDLTIEP